VEAGGHVDLMKNMCFEKNSNFQISLQKFPSKPIPPTYHNSGPIKPMRPVSDPEFERPRSYNLPKNGGLGTKFEKSPPLFISYIDKPICQQDTPRVEGLTARTVVAIFLDHFQFFAIDSVFCNLESFGAKIRNLC
jgi:hypothetical protein